MASAHLDDRALSVLKRFLALDTPLAGAPAALAAFADEAGIDIASALAGFDDRVAALDACGFAAGTARYQSAFGRPAGLLYGPGVRDGRRRRGAGGGGRYDRLLTLLGASAPIPAVGFSLWLDRIAAARDGEAG